MLAISIGFLAGGIFDICHFLTFNDMNLQYLYIFLKNLSYSSSIIIAIFSTNYIKETLTKRFNLIIFLSLILLFMAISILKLLSHVDLFEIHIPHSSIGVIYSALYILAAFIYSDIRLKQKIHPFSGFVIGLFLLGISQLYISNPNYFFSYYRHGTHFINLIGLIFIFIGLKSILYKDKILTIKQKLLIYPSIFLVLSYLTLVLFCSIYLKINLPIYVNYFFLIFLIGNTIIQNYLSSKLTDPITKIIQSLPEKIHLTSNDETGILTSTINESSDLIYQYYQEIITKQNQIEEYVQREKLLRKITETIIYNSDIHMSLENISKEIAQYFNVEYVSMAHIPDNKSKKFEFLTRFCIDDTKLNLNYDDKLLEYWCNLLCIEENYIAINNLKEAAFPTFFKEFYLNQGTKSILFVKIKKDNNVWGGIGLQTFYDYKNWTVKDIEFLKAIAYQIYIAVKQAELYLKTKKQAEREALLRKIIETIRSTLDINEVLTIICDEVAKLFNVQRATIIEYPNKNNYFAMITRREYKARKNFKGLDAIEYDRQSGAYVAKTTFEYGVINIDNISKSDTPDYFKISYKNLGVKSLLCIPIRQGEDNWGIMGLSEHDYYRHWTQDDISLLQTIADQVYIAIKQAELYSTTKEFADRELILRELISTIRSTLDINEIKRTFVNEIGLYFKADRVIFSEFDSEKNAFLPTDEYSEYLSVDYTESLIGVDWGSEKYNIYTQSLKKQSEININDLDKYIKRHNLENSDFEKLFRKWQIKSSYNIVIMYGQEIMGFFCIDYMKEKFKIGSNELEFLRTLANQAGIALYQSKLFNHLKQTAKNEKTMAKIISTIKSNLNIDEILMLICNKLTHLFNVTRISIDEFIPLTKSIQTYKIYNFDTDQDFNSSYDYLTREFLFDHLIDKGSNLIIDDIQNSNLPNKEFLTDKNLLSILAIPLRISDKRWGAIFIYDKNIRKWTNSEINLLKKIADYISLAIRDSNLYTQAQFVANVSHELKNPIAIISGYTETLINRDKELSEMSTKFLPVIKNNTDRINAIVENLLDLSNLNNNPNIEQFDFKKTELKYVIEEVIQHSQEKAQEKSITITLNYNGPLYVNMNEFMFNQVLINLINNAINYSESNTKITINAFIENSKIKIEFHDQGCGIKEEHLPYIFERFYRVDKSRNRETGGTGLGLSIVKSILNIHGGIITVSSKFGEGSIFTIELDCLE
ncbi:MAG: GAF domain-containing protein [Candidatus Gastranaerophilales bacterium]|nr:GAF domain-containing protein [Candidatus Gastranaerophilales bacterium]